jgi:integrase
VIGGRVAYRSSRPAPCACRLRSDGAAPRVRRRSARSSTPAWSSTRLATKRDTARTAAGERTLPLDPGTAAALRELRARQAADRLGAGPAYEPADHGGYVAADELGHGYTTQQLRNTFRRVVGAGDLRPITFHHARHSTLSYLLNSGQVPVAIVAAWAGHADGGATALKHYIKVRPGDLDAARDALAKLLGA